MKETVKGREEEIRCEEVHEILSRPPHALVRWGITVLLGVLGLVFIGGCFFQYPDTVTADITVTTEHPPFWIVARGTGKIKEVYAQDRARLEAGTLIAVLENPASTEDVLGLEESLRGFVVTDSVVLQGCFPEHPVLGGLQSGYATFLKYLTDYRNFLSIDLYGEKIGSTRQELQEYRRYIGHLDNQMKLQEQQMEIAAVQHERERTLLEKGLIAQADFEEVRRSFLNQRQSREQLAASLSSARIQEAQLQQTILETEMERERERNTLRTGLQTACEELRSALEEWKLTYLFVSPTDGILSYNNVWQKNQHVNGGDRVFAIVEEKQGDIIGKIKLPVAGAGKIAADQRVNISVAGYPYMEFGFLTGRVLSVSLLADEENTYMVTVSLPQDLRTSYGKQLEFTGELSGTAEIMTDERSVTERLFGPLRHVWEKYLSAG